MRVKDLTLRWISYRITVDKIFSTYPASIGVQESPPNTVCSDLLHAAASIQEHGKHALAQVNNLLILLCARRVRGVVCHGMLLGDGGYNQGRMQPGQCLTQRREFRVSSAHFEVLWNSQYPNYRGSDPSHSHIRLSGWCRQCIFHRSPHSFLHQ